MNSRKHPSKKQLTEIIDIAINDYLWDGGYEGDFTKVNFSCDAIAEAILELHNKDFSKRVALENTFRNILRECGLPDFSQNAFFDIQSGAPRQYARALWLTWVQLMIQEGVV